MRMMKSETEQESYNCTSSTAPSPNQSYLAVQQNNAIKRPREASTSKQSASAANNLLIVPSYMPLRPQPSAENPSVFTVKTNIENLSDSRVKVKFWSSGIPRIVHYLPGNLIMEPYESQYFELTFINENEDLKDEQLEVRFVQQLVKQETVYVHVFVQKKGQLLHCDPLTRPCDFTLDINVQGTVEVYRVFGRALTEFSKWKELLLEKMAIRSKRKSNGNSYDWDLFWDGVKLDNEQSPFSMGMQDMCKLEAKKVAKITPKKEPTVVRNIPPAVLEPDCSHIVSGPLGVQKIITGDMKPPSNAGDVESAAGPVTKKARFVILTKDGKVLVPKNLQI